jgi:hypothetical protein
MQEVFLSSGKPDLPDYLVEQICETNQHRQDRKNDPAGDFLFLDREYTEFPVSTFSLYYSRALLP